jgi:hypothetical protein
MNDLAIKELEEKVKSVQDDINNLALSGNAGRKLEVLSEYKSYLEDEIKFLKNEQKASGIR